MPNKEFVEDDFQEIADNTDPYERFAITLHEATGNINEDALYALTLQLAGAPHREATLGNDKRGDIHLSLTHDSATNISHLISVLCDLHPNGTAQLNGTNTTATGVLGDTRSGTLDPGPLLNPDTSFTAIEQFSALKNDAQAAFAQILNTQNYSFSTSNFRDTVPAPGSILITTEFNYGRFDEYEPLGEQINLTPTISEAVDLVLQNHSEDNPTFDPDIEPFDAAFAKAYLNDIRSINPNITSDTNAYIDDYVTDIQNATDEDNPFTVNVSRLSETLTRLTQAHARLRRSTVARPSDAKRITTLFENVYSPFGLDLSEPDFDADALEAGEPVPNHADPEDYARRIRTVIKDLEDSNDKGAPLERIHEQCESKGLDQAQIDDGIHHLRFKGEVYEPTAGYFRTT